MQYVSSAFSGPGSPLTALWLLLLLLAAWRQGLRWGLPVLALVLGWHMSVFADALALFCWSVACLALSWLAWRRHPAVAVDPYEALARNQAQPAWRVAAWLLLMAVLVVVVTMSATAGSAAQRCADVLGMVIIIVQVVPAWSLLMQRLQGDLPACPGGRRETLLWWSCCALVFLLVGLVGESITFMGIIDGTILVWPLLIWACLRLGRVSACLAIMLIPGGAGYMQHAGMGGTPPPFLVFGASGVTLMPAVHVVGAVMLHGWRCWSLGPADPAERCADVAPPFALRPTLSCCVCAFFTGLAVVAFLVQQAGWQTGFVLDRLVQETNRILSHAEDGLKDMLAQRVDGCTEDDKAYLAQKARQTAFVRDTGILNGAGEPLCQSGEGLPRALLKRHAPEGLSYLIAPAAQGAALDVALAYRSPGGITAYALLDIAAITWYLGGFSSQREEHILLKLDEREIVHQDGEVSGGRLVRRTQARYAPHFLLEASITTGQRAILSGYLPYAATLLNVAAIILIIAILIASLRDQERRAKIKARAEGKARSEFLAIMSHEIRTPLNGLLGNLELLKAAQRDVPARPEWTGALEDAWASSRTLLAIINNVLDMSRIDAGRMTLEPAPFGVRELAGRVLQVHAANARSKQLALVLELDPALPACLVGDATRIEQILGNLISNAIKFTPAQGRIVLGIAQEEPPERGGAGVQVGFSVQDNGVGIAPEHLQRLCEPFFQATAHPQGGIAGSGLGLSICNRLVALMGGKFSVSSRAGAGARFAFCLSLEVGVLPRPEAAPAQALRAAVPASLPEARLPLLIVDDHPIALDLLERQLAQLGLAAVAAHSAEEAFSLFLEAGPFAALLTDQNMPGSSGTDLARRVRQHEAQSAGHLPILLCTADLTLQTELLKAENQIDDVLFKPYTLADLAGLLERYIDRRGDAVPREWQPEAAAQLAANWASGSLGMLLDAAAGNRQVAARLLRVLHRSTDADLVVLARCLDAADLQGAARRAHRIKGAARMIGALAMGDAAERCERAAREQDWSQGASLLPVLDAANQELLQIAGQLDAQ